MIVRRQEYKRMSKVRDLKPCTVFRWAGNYYLSTMRSSPYCDRACVMLSSKREGEVVYLANFLPVEIIPGYFQEGEEEGADLASDWENNDE